MGIKTECINLTLTSGNKNHEVIRVWIKSNTMQHMIVNNEIKQPIDIKLW
jgi:hypothetical protein